MVFWVVDSAASLPFPSRVWPPYTNPEPTQTSLELRIWISCHYTTSVQTCFYWWQKTVLTFLVPFEENWTVHKTKLKYKLCLLSGQKIGGRNWTQKEISRSKLSELLSVVVGLKRPTYTLSSWTANHTIGKDRSETETTEQLLSLVVILRRLPTYKKN